MTTSVSAPEPPALRWIIYGLTVLVCVVVSIVLYALPARGGAGSPGPLPTLNAVLNGSAGFFLLLGYLSIRRRRPRAHRSCMVIAFGLSTAFFVSYLVHHAQVGSVPFQGTGALRWVYFAILIPHVLLATTVVPLALFTIYRGWTNRLAAHRRVARWALPIWLYVSVSGVLVYLMLHHL